MRRELRRWLREIHDRTEHTTVFVTHDQEEALELADRVVVMSEGKIEQIGTPDEIYDRPSSPFVFSFIGEANKLLVNINSGQIWLDDHFLDLAVGDMPSGPAQLFAPRGPCGGEETSGGRNPGKGARRAASRRSAPSQSLKLWAGATELKSTYQQILALNFPSRSEFVRAVTGLSDAPCSHRRLSPRGRRVTPGV